jgi:hypothetical protein
MSHSPAAAASQRIGGCPLEICGEPGRGMLRGVTWMTLVTAICPSPSTAIRQPIPCPTGSIPVAMAIFALPPWPAALAPLAVGFSPSPPLCKGSWIQPAINLFLGEFSLGSSPASDALGTSWSGNLFQRATELLGAKQRMDRQTPVLTSSEWGLISERRGKRILRGKESRRAVERCESLKMAFSPKDRCAEPFSPFQQPPPHFPLSAPLLTASRGKVHPSTLSAPPLELPNLGRATASSISGDAAALSLPPSLPHLHPIFF